MGRLFRVESVQPDEAILFREKGKRRRQVVKCIDLVVQLSERVETFKDGVILQLRQPLRWDTRAIKLVFKRLQVEQLVWNDGTTNSHARREGIQTYDRSTSRARTGKDILNTEMKVILSGARVNLGDSGTEAAEFRRIRIRRGLDGVDDVDRKTKSIFSRDRISDRRGVDAQIALVRSSALDVNMTIRSANDPRD